MATLVLSTVGTILGGPVGGAIGSLLGQSIDQQLFGPGPHQGPRLGDLAVQTSSYGTPIPRLFGTMRVAGSIVWSTDLQEDSQTEGAKGQPETVTYSYSVSFAVALSSRRITDIKRIWADGKLIRAADGEFTISTGFRFHSGSEEQPVDPLIASIEGIDSTPAYRGCSMAVFEHMQLAEFGNRIPFLTFEVEADSGAVPIGDVLADVSEGAITSSSTISVVGYAAYGPTISAAVEPLVEAFGIPLFDDGSALVSPMPNSVVVSSEELGCSAGTPSAARSERTQIAARSLPSALALSYYDPAREYQTGLARASLAAVANGDERLEMPAVLEASAAKALAETCIARRWAERDRLRLRLPPAYMGIEPGALILPPGEQVWKVERLTLDSMAVVAELRPVYSVIDAVPADPGRVLSSVGVAPAPTTIAVVELPDDGSGEANSPVVAVAASSSAGSWRAVPLHVEIGETAFASRSAAAPAIMGVAQTALAGGQSAVLDLLNSVEIQLSNPDEWLESRDDAALAAAGASLALLGNELLQFGDALPLPEPGRFRLSRLVRGRRSSEWAMGLHATGEPFVMLDPARLQRLRVTSDQVGAKIRVRAIGLADAAAAPVELVPVGEATKPPSPVHLRASVGPDGVLRCSWVRRSRQGWAWLDYVDAPLGAATERYRVTLQSAGAAIELETSAPEAGFGAADLVALGPGEIQVTVVQVGDLGISRPASLFVSIS